jgi:LuxR family transcriptional regulator, maltose regulon positive regulatory protein
MVAEVPAAIVLLRSELAGVRGDPEGDHQGALALLVEALARGAPEGYLRVFLDEGPPMAALLHRLLVGRRQQRLLAAGAASQDHLARLVDAFEQAGRPVRPPVRRGGAAAIASAVAARLPRW